MHAKPSRTALACAAGLVSLAGLETDRMRAAPGAFVERLKLVNAHVAGKVHGDDVFTPDQAVSVAGQAIAKKIAVLVTQGTIESDFWCPFDVGTGQRIVSWANGLKEFVPISFCRGFGPFARVH